MNKTCSQEGILQDENIKNDTQETDSLSVFTLPVPARFWLLVVFEFPSLICSSLLLYYLTTVRGLRQSLNNHVIIALLIIGLFSQLIDIPSYLNYLRINYVWPSTPAACILWWFAATGISNLTNLVMAWASIERHILVFHDRWILNKKKQIYFHYFPLFGIVAYGFIYYILIMSIFPCENMYSYTFEWCLYPCFYQNDRLALYDTLVNSILPTPIIAIFSIRLIIRVVDKRQILHRHVQWRKYRLMIVQLLSLTALFLFFNLPMTILVLAHVCGLPTGSTGQFEFYAYYLYHFVSLLIPFVCLSSLPTVRKRIRSLIRLQRRGNIITPAQAQLR